LISYGQNLEDVMLARVFHGRKDGFYVDVGAADPINLSVTKWFYDLGWSGINIEPNKKLFDRLAADRPRDINLDCGVGATASQASFFEPEIGELSTFDRRAQAAARKAGTPGTTRAVSVFPLTDLLKRYCEGRHIDFLKIDVEGWEHEVLKGLDLGLYRPTILVIESTIPQSCTPSHALWEPLVLAAAYTFVYFDGINRFYLANENLELKRHFDAPPNALDNFEPYSLVIAKAAAEERLKSIHKLESLLSESERDRRARLSSIQMLEKRLSESERDREARLSVIQSLEKRLAECEHDREARLADVQAIQKRLNDSERDREARLKAMEDLQKRLVDSEADRQARLVAMHELERRLSESERDREASLAEVQRLERDLQQANASLRKVFESRFWKITHPKLPRLFR
jgi:FkbM family methyltransferase